MRRPDAHPFAGLRELEPPARGPLATALRELGPLETADEVIGETRRLVDAGLLNLPLPTRGETARRFHAFAELAATDLSLARIAEGHADAHAILAEAYVRAQRGLYGVWAADAPDRRVTAIHRAGGWVLRGRKRFCSGASGLDRALVTASDGDASLLFDVALATDGIERVGGSWQAIGMATTDSLDVIFDEVEVDDPIGVPGFYLQRPGFWHGAVGVAACWYGGALGALRMLRARSTAMTEHQAAHLGGVVAACEMMRRILDGAAGEIDDSSGGEDHAGRWRALVVRHVVEQGCQDVLERVGRAGGTSPLVFDRAHAKRAADLLVYLRQHHAERDLAELGRLAVNVR
jgi:alkylation response protein AidB-like acyl-CoA dehydrogenase